MYILIAILKVLCIQYCLWVSCYRNVMLLHQCLHIYHIFHPRRHPCKKNPIHFGHPHFNAICRMFVQRKLNRMEFVSNCNDSYGHLSYFLCILSRISYPKRCICRLANNSHSLCEPLILWNESNIRKNVFALNTKGRFDPET